MADELPPLTAEPLRVAFQGAAGAFSEDAVRSYFGERVAPVPHREFRDVGAALASADADFGLLPVENSLAGSVLPSYDVLACDGLQVVGEIIVPIHHCVLGLTGSTLDDIEQVLSHPVALAQCERFLIRHPGIAAIAVYDTAGAAAQVAAGTDRTIAAIASRTAAAMYGLAILAADIEDRPDNQTRFLVVAGEGESARMAAASRWRRGAPYRTTVLVETANSPGALVNVLQPFADRGINLSKLESRPGIEPWTYRFFLELDGSADSPRTRAALEAAGRVATELRVLGSYGRWIE